MLGPWEKAGAPNRPHGLHGSSEHASLSAWREALQCQPSLTCLPLPLQRDLVAISGTLDWGQGCYCGARHLIMSPPQVFPPSSGACGVIMSFPSSVLSVPPSCTGLGLPVSRRGSWRRSVRCCSSSTACRWTSCACRTRVWRLRCAWSARPPQRRSEWTPGPIPCSRGSLAPGCRLHYRYYASSA